MGAKVFGGILFAFGIGMLALGAVNYLGYGLGLDGNTPIFAVGLILMFLGWLKWGDTAKTSETRPSSISDNDRQR
jgi:hypothetical protein